MFLIYRTLPFDLTGRRRRDWGRSLLCKLMTLCCMIFSVQVQAQTRPGLISFQRIAIPDEVPAQLSSALAQDAQGLIWIGTQDGLVRYDGYTFKVYQPKSGDPTSLSGSYIRSICVAKDGRLWVGSISDGLSIFDPRTEKFTQFRHDATRQNSLAHDHVEAIAEDRDGHFWLATDNGLDRFDPTSGTFEHFQHDPQNPASLANNQVRALLMDHEGELWVGTREGLQRRISATGAFISIGNNPDDADSLVGQHITKLFEDTHDQIWIGTVNAGAAVLNVKSGRLHRLRAAIHSTDSNLSHYWVYSFVQAADGEVWVGTYGGGIDIVDPQSLKIVDRLHHDSALTSTIGGDRIGAMLVDKSGLVWVGTWGGGIAWHDPSTRAFLKWRHSPNNPDGPTHVEIVRSMEMSDGTIWLGTNGNGIDIMTGDGHLRGGFRPIPADPYSLADGAVTCLAQSADGTIWVATLDGTLHRMRMGSGMHVFERFSTGRGLPGGPIRTMVFAADGALWAGSVNGLARIDPVDDHVKVFVHRDNDSTSLSGREVESLAFTPDGTLWVGTENGINAFNAKTGKSVRVMHEPARADSLPDNWVPDLMVTKNGSLWLATQSGVAILTQWDGQVAHFDALSARLHLPTHPADSLIEDSKGFVWLGSRIRIDPTTWKFKKFGPADGDEFRTLYIASRTRTRQGELLFGTPEGLLVVRPDLLREWAFKPRLIVSAASIGNNELSGATRLQRIDLNSQQRNLRLEFSALDFSAPQQLRYRYRLDGYDSDWVNANAEDRLAVYTGLPPGDYQLRIQGSNRNGTWSPDEQQIIVSVAPTYYQTLWFRLLLVSTILLVIATLSQWRVRQLNLRGQLLERAVTERTADLQAAYRKIESASLTDSLTNLHNRRFLEKSIQAELDLATRHQSTEPDQQNSDLVLLMLDIDHFKQVNDVYGHAAGDAVLVQTADLLKQCMRASDYVVRWGGEEFILVARRIERSQAVGLAEKIRATIARHPYKIQNDQIIYKTISIGFVTFPFIAGHPHPISLDTLQRMADIALYAAKRSWRNAWVGIEAMPQSKLSDDALIEQFLTDAQAAVAAGLVTVLATPGKVGMLRWK